MKARLFRVLGLLIFVLGFALGLFIHGGTAWADFEAFMFDSQLTADGPLRSFSCPPLITPGEDKEITVSVSNPSEDPVRRRVRVHITQGMVALFREEDQYYDFEPGETKHLAWTVSAEDAAYDRFILVRVYLFRRYPLTSATATCGVLVLDFLGMPANQILWLSTGLSLVLMTAGIVLWTLPSRPIRGKVRELTLGMVAVTICVISGIILNILNIWMGSVLLLILVVLLSFVVLMQFILLE